MSLFLGQLIYTSFPKVGFKTFTSAKIPEEIQQAFMQKVVYQYWNSYDPPKFGYRAAYLQQITLKDNLFGWLYNDGLDDNGRRHVPYFVCYYLAERLQALQLDNIFTLLCRGPALLMDRQIPASLETTVIPDLCSYQPTRVGVVIPLEVRERSHRALEQGQLLDLLVPDTENEVVNDGTGKKLERSQQLQLSNVSGVSFVTQPSSQSNNKATADNGSLGNASKHTANSNTSPPGLFTQQPRQNQPHYKRDVGLRTDDPQQTAQQRSSRSQRQQREWSLQAKATAWALAVSMLPVLVAGTTYYLGSQPITKQITQARQAGTIDLAETELTLQRQLSLLLVGTGGIAVLAGVIAAFVANQAIHPALSAAAVSTRMVNRLRREKSSTADSVTKDELATLEANIGLIEKQLPDLLWKQEAEVERFQVLMNIVRRIQESLSEEDVLRTTVEEARKALRTDRVVIFRFDSNEEGTFIEESVAPSWPKMLWATIHDSGFEREDLEQYRNGHVRAIDDIHQANLTDFHVGFWERFAVKANLVAPILKDDKLFGLLIAHQCSGPRAWQQPEIDLFAQLAMQVGFALDHARLLDQVEQAYQAAEVVLREQRQQKEALQHQVSELFRDSKIAVEDLSAKALGQMESVTVAYNQTQAVADSARGMTAIAQQAKLQTHQANQTVQAGHEAMSRIVEGISTMQKSFAEAAVKVKHLHQVSQKLLEVTGFMDNVTSQIKLQAMNATLEAARAGDAGQGFASIAEKVQSLARQLDANVAEIKPPVAKIQMETYEVGTAIGTGTEQVIVETQLVEEAQQKLNQIATISAQMNTLVEELTQAAAGQAQTSTCASQSVLEVANLASHISERSLSVVEPFSKLAAAAQEP